ncbi:quinon protein alcohol dehydrogenase-like superfamily [Trichoderma barbatum]
MSEKPPGWFQRHFGKKLKPGKGQGDPSKASTTSTPTTQSRDASPSRAATLLAIESQTDSIISGTNYKLSQVEVSTPAALPSDASERLWDEAYDAIIQDNAKLGSISDSGTPQLNAIAANSPDVRRRQMNELIRAASIAWSGVCVALGVLESAVEETASNRDGIEYIITRIRWYGNVSSILIDEGALAGPALSGMKSELETACRALQSSTYISDEDFERTRNPCGHAKTQEFEIKIIKKTLKEQLGRQISAEDQHCMRELPNRPLLWIRGDPGKGKTMLLCGIVDNLQKLAPYSFISFFFCQATDERINNSTSVLRGLIFSLVDQQRHLLKHVREHYVRQGKSLFEPPGAWYALSGILQSLLLELSNSQQPTCLLVDALDECVSEDMPRLLDFVVKMSKELPYVKWVFSSRNWTHITDKLKSLGPEAQLNLELNAESVATAVRICINQEVLQLSENGGYSKHKEEAVRDYLLSNAEGTFLWVALVCRNLKRTPSWNVLHIMEAFPPGLDSLYEHMVRVLLQSQEAEVCKRILAVATVALQPVTLQELIALAETSGEPDEKTTAVRDLIMQCGSFLTVRDEVVYFANLYMTARSIKLMSEILRRDIYCLNDLGINIDVAQALDPNPLIVIGYSCVFWIDHFTKYPCSLEALCLLKKMPEGVIAMRKLQEFFKKQSRKDSKGLIRDAYRFILAAKPIIEIFPLQIHPLAHFICPIRSKIRELSIKHQPELFQMRHGMQLDWDSCVQTIDADLLEKPCIALSPDGKLMASASPSGVRIWDMATGTVLKKFRHPYHSHTRQLAVSSSVKRGVIIWNIDSGEHRTILDGYIYAGCHLSFSLDERYLALDWNDSVKIWDMDSSECIRTLKSTGRIISVPFSPNGKLLASCSTEKTINIWDEAGKCIHKNVVKEAWHTDFNNHPYVCFSPDISSLAFCDSNHNIKTLESEYEVNLITFLINGKSLAVAIERPGEGIDIWDIDSNKNLRRLKGHFHWIHSIAVSPDGNISSEADDSKMWEGHDDLFKMAFPPDGKKLASGSMDKTIEIWDTTTEGRVQILVGHQEAVHCITFSPHGRLLASGSSDTNVKIWDVAKDICIQTLKGHTKLVSLVKFSPDSQQLASESHDDTIRIWDLSKGSSITLRLPGSENESTKSIDFSIDGKALAFSSPKGTLYIWDTISGIFTQTLHHAEHYPCVAFSPCGEILASSSSQSVKLWRKIDGPLVYRH